VITYCIVRKLNETDRMGYLHERVVYSRGKRSQTWKMERLDRPFIGG